MMLGTGLRHKKYIAITICLSILFCSVSVASQKQAKSVKLLCDKYKKDLNNKFLSVTAKLEYARCLSKQNIQSRYYLDVLTNDLLGREIEIMHEAFNNLKSTKLKYQLFIALLKPVKIFAQEQRGSVFAIKTSGLSAYKKELLAEIYAWILKEKLYSIHEEIKYIILEKLYFNLAETKASSDIFAQLDAQKWSSKLSVNHKLMRARLLTKHHKNKDVISLLSSLINKTKQAKNNLCEINYLLGFAYRKSRQYNDAIKYMKFAANNCANSQFKLKSRYLLIKLAFIKANKAAVNLASAFLFDYPNHSYSDDVLLWKARFFVSKSQWKKASKSYKAIIKNYSNGDMYQDALLEHAFVLLKSGKINQSIIAFKNLSQRSDLDNFHSNAAKYWHGRLKIFPHITSFKRVKNPLSLEKGINLLLVFTKNRPAGYYSILANSLLDYIAKQNYINKKYKDLIKQRKNDFIITGAKKAFISNKVIEKHPNYKFLSSWLKHGYKKNAFYLLEQIDSTTISYDDKIALAKSFYDNDFKYKNHQILRSLGKAHMPGKPKKSNLQLWHFSYPKAYVKDFSFAKNKYLPSFLLLALCREESAFTAHIRSWAGAMGICQLMKSTAFSEGKYVGLSPSEEELYSVKVNTKLAASHLSRNIKKFKHPFLAVAAYNSGAGNVRRWLKNYRSNTAIDIFIEQIPFLETRNYVKKVINSWVIYSYLYGNIKNAEVNILLP